GSGPMPSSKGWARWGCLACARFVSALLRKNFEWAWTMYQCLSVIPPAPSTADAENEGHEHTHDLVGHQEEYGGDGHHYEYHGSGDGGLAPTRPRDLLRLGAHLLQELRRTDLPHRAYLPLSRGAAHNPLRCLDFADRAGLRLAGVEEIAGACQVNDLHVATTPRPATEHIGLFPKRGNGGAS